MLTPPPAYTPFYCEENIWQLCQHPALAQRRCDVVFISNNHGGCALWAQRASPHEGGVIVWDYHVVLLVHDERGAELWDLDSTGGCPQRFERWWALTFPYGERVPPRLRPMFRVIDRARFAQVFSSDRSHMLDEHARFSAPPPSWPRIGQGPSNLMEFVSMREGLEGQVMSARELVAYASVSGSQSVKVAP